LAREQGLGGKLEERTPWLLRNGVEGGFGERKKGSILLIKQKRASIGCVEEENGAKANRLTMNK